MNQLKNSYWLQFLIITLLLFTMIFTGIKWISWNLSAGQNILAFLILSLILGLIFSGLYSLKYKIASMIFAFSLLIGFYEMYQIIIRNMDATGDFAGLAMLFNWAILGLGIGLFAELCLYSYHRFNRTQ